MAKVSRKLRKNVRLSQDKLTRAQQLLGATTEKETIEQALDLVAFRHEVILGVQRLSGTRRLSPTPDETLRAIPIAPSTQRKSPG